MVGCSVIEQASSHDTIAARGLIGFAGLVERVLLNPSMRAFVNRLKASAVGFAWTVAPLCFAAVAQFILLPQTVGTILHLDRDQHTQAVSVLRSDWLVVHATAMTLLAIYWILTAVLGRGELLRLKAANVTLALFVFGVIVLTCYGTFVIWPDALKGICPVLGLSDTDSPPFGFDVPTSCQAFTNAVHQIAILGLMGSPILFLATSCVIRVVSSRRASSASD